ncbi:hypothetical protein QZH41_003086 [Actinostola sp. cb2023]|nr:hypothetical protein QZH41_003086 [Actinostola sp. cb2023]
MDGYIQKGHARKLSKEEVSTQGPRTWYLPHFGVTNEHKPGKVRIVFDAAAEFNGTSLNKNLLQGPDRTNNLIGVLMQFRQERVALVADIEGMFHQIKVRREDQDSLRFLWWSDSIHEPPDEYTMNVHVFGATDSPCAANSTLRKTADDNSEAFDSDTVNTVKNNFYVDDVLKSLPNSESAISMARQLMELCGKGGFKLTKFTSNDRETEEHWPETSFQEIAVEQLEVKKEIYATKLEPASAIDELINRSSSWIVTLRKVAWLLKFVDWIKNRSLQKNVEKAPEVQNMICQDDIERAKKRVAAIVQKKTYPDEVKYLSEGKRVKASSEIVRLKPVMKGDRVVRVGGRISMAPISEDAMNPMILPKEHHITTILIRHIHQRNGHCGVEQTLCILREQFWVVKARVAIKKVLGKCIQCRKRMAPKAQQEMASLPKIRLTPYEPPFTYAGVDYFGPLWVKRGRGRVMEKRWGAIFVCMNTRAVHLEVAKSLETDDFILVLMRFLNRRGHVKELRSDNGTNFVGAEREITESIKKMDHDKLGRELIKRGCNWVFHPPGASHMSGVWERLVRTVKRSLKAILGNSPMNDEVLSTVFTEAERIANSRPLTRNPLSPNDDDPLTPNHFLNIRPTANMPTEVYDETDNRGNGAF